MTAEAGNTIQSGIKMMSVLDKLAAASDDMGVVDIAKSLELPVSTTHRLLATLIAGGMVEQADTGKYRLGVKLIELGYAALEKLDLRREALPEMRKLAQQTNLMVNLAQLDHDHIIYLEKVADTANYALNIRVGQRRSAYCRALGKVLLADLTDEEVLRRLGNNLPRLTPYTIVEPTALLADLARIREVGYGIDREEAQVGTVCLAAPIRDASGSVVAAVSASGISDEIKRRSEAELVDAVIRCGEAISRRLGYSCTNGIRLSHLGA